eukprot:scaffold8877_cov112-Isochrysis_galbana.AAC.7
MGPAAKPGRAHSETCLCVAPASSISCMHTHASGETPPHASAQLACVNWRVIGGFSVRSAFGQEDATRQASIGPTAGPIFWCASLHSRPAAHGSALLGRAVLWKSRHHALVRSRPGAFQTLAHQPAPARADGSGASAERAGNVRPPEEGVVLCLELQCFSPQGEIPLVLRPRPRRLLAAQDTRVGPAVLARDLAGLARDPPAKPGLHVLVELRVGQQQNIDAPQPIERLLVVLTRDRARGESVDGMAEQGAHQVVVVDRWRPGEHQRKVGARAGVALASPDSSAFAALRTRSRQ